MSRTDQEEGRRRALLLAGVVLLLAAGLRIPQLGESLWLDEIVSAQMASSSWTERGRVLETWDPHPPLFYSALDWLAPPSAPEWRLRLVPLLFGLLHVAALAWVAGLLWGRPGALATAAVAAVSWDLARVSFELRSFGLANLLATVAWAGTISWLRGGARGWLVVTGVAAAGALYTFYYAVVPLLGLVAFVLVFRPAPRRAWALLLSGLVAVLLFAPWLPTFSQQVGMVRARTASGYGAPPFLDLTSQLSLLRSQVFRLGLSAALALGVLAALDLRARVHGRPGSALARVFRDRRLRAVGAYGLACIGVILVVWAAGSFNSSRYATFLAGIWAVFAAGCFVRLGGPAGAVMLTLVLVVGGARTLSHVTREEKDDWRGAVEALDVLAPPHETLLIQRELARCYDYYSRARRQDARFFSLPGEGEALREVQLPELEGLSRVWVLWSPLRRGEAREAVLQALDDAALPETGAWWFRGVGITRHERARAAAPGR